MNEAHFHLMINHIPVIFPILALLILIIGLVLKSDLLKRLSYFVVVLTSIIGIFVFQSGEGAEEIVEHMQGMDHDLIEEHEEMAEKFIIISHLTGLFALLAFYLNWQKKQLAKLASIGMLFLLIIYIGLAAITANTGGVIHHPEMLDGKVQHTHDD